MKFFLAAALAISLAGPALAQPAAAPATTADAIGQIKSVDAKAGALTIHHGPIAALGWPAMTMTFKASPEALQAAKTGQTVRFTLKTPENEIIAVRPQ